MLGTLAAKLMTDESKQNRDNRETRLEKARKELLKTLEALRSGGTLSPKEADAVEAAIEDELIAARVGHFPSGERIFRVGCRLRLAAFSIWSNAPASRPRSFQGSGL